MQVVVQTYPAHLYQTLLCLQHIQKLNIASQVILVMDDLSNFSWPEYTTTCESVYQGLADRFLRVSDNALMYRLKSWPWLRQQTTKLYLDTMIESQEWLFIDGDVRLHDCPPKNCVPASTHAYVGVPLDLRDPQPGEMSSQVLFYIRHMLGVNFAGFWHDQSTSTVITASHPPIKYMQAQILKSLRQHIETRLGKRLVDAHLDIALDTRMAPCEWDLIECFRQQILQQPADWFAYDDFFQTTWQSDRELGLEWFAARQVSIDEEIWLKLPERKNLF